MTHKHAQGRSATKPTGHCSLNASLTAGFGVLLELDSPLATVAASCVFNAARHKELLDLSIDPVSYGERDGGRFRDDYQAVELLSKFPGLESGIDTASVAIQKFMDSEQACAETNVRFKRIRDTRDLKDSLSGRNVLDAAAAKIASVLGPFSWDRAARHFTFGPGASISVPRHRGDAY